MIINEWIGHPELSRDQELLIHLYKMRMATRRNLAVVMGKTLGSIDQQLFALRRKGDYIRSFRPRGKHDQSVYYLGVDGAKIVGEILGKRVSFYEYRGAQARHFTGINDILTRLIDRIGLDAFKEATEWRFTGECRDALQAEWAELLLENIQQGHISEDQAGDYLTRLIEPDASFTFNGQSNWLEFDNATESHKKLKRKLEDTIYTLVSIGDQSPIIWVITQRVPARAQQLKRIWEEVQAEQIGNYPYLPHMEFFLEGQETEYILSKKNPSPIR